MKPTIPDGVYPTMITPYTKDNHIDFGALDAMVEWYAEHGCDGLFAVCQSSEIFHLTLDERIGIADRVRKKVDELAGRGRPAMAVVASGHISDSMEAQADELRAIWETGADAMVWISNRLDIANTSDEAWIRDAEKLLDKLPEDMPLGIYECPYPYKRLLTEPILKWCISTGRFRFIKDTCCDAALIRQRLKLLDGTGLKLFNANAQTLLESMRDGGAGYCGVMANFHPDLYVWLHRNFPAYPDKAERMQALLCLAAFTEALAYPVTAKYNMNLEGIRMETLSRVRDAEELTAYHRSVIDQMRQIMIYTREEINQII